MVFDRQKLEDEYIKMNAIILSTPPDSMAELYDSAENYRVYATGIYTILTKTIYAQYPPLLRTINEYSSQKDFDELEELIKNCKNEEQLKDYKDALKEFISRFTKEANLFNEKLTDLLKRIQQYRTDLEKNFREDLTSGAFFYGRVEKALQIRGKQIAEMASIIKDYYIAPINALKEKIKEYDDKIDEFFDPQNRFDAFMKALPSADEFSSLTKFADEKPDAQVEAMKAAYSVAIKGIEYIGKKIVTVKQMEERRNLQDELNELMKKYDEYKSKYTDVIDEYNLVKNLVVILNGMKFFSESSKNIIDTLSLTVKNLQDYARDKNIEVYNREIINLQSYFEKFWK